MEDVHGEAGSWHARRPMKRSLLAAVGLALVCAMPVFAAPAGCAKLVVYRDQDLVADLDRASKKLTMASGALELLRKTEREAKDLEAKQPGVNAAFQLTLSLQTVASAVGSILKLNPETGILMTGAGRAQSWVVKAAESGQVAIASASDALPAYVFWETVGDAGMVGAALKGAYEFAEHVKQHKEEYADGKEIVEDLRVRIGALKGALMQAQARVDQQSNILRAVNQFRNEIDKTCK